jgi:carboxyl-terminal processing protease
MTRGRLLFASVSILCVIAIASGTFARAVAREEASDDSLYKSLSVFSEVLNLIRRTYVDETSVDQLFSGALDGTTDALDSMSTFVPGDHVEKYRRTLEIGTSHSGVSVVKDRGIAYVLAVAPGSPGEASELERGDALAQIAGRPTRNMPLWELQTILAGEPGTELVLEVVRRGQSEERTLTLGAFEPQPPSLERRDELPVVQLARLEDKTVAELRSLLEEIAEARDEHLLLDLRGVAGGSSEAAYQAADLFVSGQLGALQRRSETLETFTGEQAPVWQGRLVVLIDRATQGAGEILAAVLQQAAAADLVGERTFGHAGRQSAVSLSTGGELFLTDAFYTGPDNEPLNSSLVPEVAVTEGNRNLSEADVPLRELILRRGLERLREEEEPELEQVA